MPYPYKKGFVETILSLYDLGQAAIKVSDPVFIGLCRDVSIGMRLDDPNDANAPTDVAFTVEVAFVRTDPPAAGDWFAYDKLLDNTAPVRIATKTLLAPAFPATVSGFMSMSPEDDGCWIRITATAAAGAVGDHTFVSMWLSGGWL